MLYVARVAQGFAASVIWIVGSATLADTVGADNMGKTLGTISIFTTAGQFAGPMVGGLLLETAGYWVAWSTAVGIVRSIPGFRTVSLAYRLMSIAPR